MLPEIFWVRLRVDFPRAGFTAPPLVVVGGQDQPCVALGMGAIDGGDAVYGLGTVECLSVVLDGYTHRLKKCWSTT